MTETAIAIMAKQPLVGSTKTRLCPPLSLESAAHLYEALLHDTIALCAAQEGIDLAVAVTPPDAMPYFESITPPETLLIPADCADIGACLRLALGELLGAGYQRAMALNSDGPTLPPAYLQRAAQLLGAHDLVLGPGEDGGYYLIGLKTVTPELFTGIDWSTARVWGQTRAKARQLGLRVATLPSWYDVDTAAELARLREEVENLPPERLVYTRRALSEAGIHKQL